MRNKNTSTKRCLKKPFVFQRVMALMRFVNVFYAQKNGGACPPMEMEIGLEQTTALE